MKVLLLAGEESGVLYARKIAAALSASVGDIEIRGYGDYGFSTADLAVMGFGAVLRKLFYFLRVKRTMERAIREWRPDVVCTVDYPGMNLKLAAYAKLRGVYTVHVVCPQVWAWKAGRIPKIESSIDKLCCFFPFEPALFKPGFAEFVGHPLTAEFDSTSSRADRRGKTLALLPGSRVGEIERNLPVMLEAAGLLPENIAKDISYVIPAANDAANGAIRKIISSARTRVEAKVQSGGARELLRSAECAVVASGTATLEAALARCPTVLVYKVSALLAWFARRVIKGVRHVGLINIIAEKSSVEPPMPELLQETFTPEAVASYLARWLSDDAARDEAVAKLEVALEKLGNGREAVARIAAIVSSGRRS